MLGSTCWRPDVDDTAVVVAVIIVALVVEVGLFFEIKSLHLWGEINSGFLGSIYLL